MMVLSIVKRVFRKLRNVYLCKKFSIPLENKVSIAKSVEIRNGKYIKWGRFCYLNDDVELCVTANIEGVTPQLVIGDNVNFGRMNRIGCDNKIIIENNVLFAPHVHVTDRNHAFEDPETPIITQKIYSNGPVVIGSDSWIGFGAQIMSGVTIGKHCVVAAGAVVTKSIPDYCVVGGNPAKILKQYNFATKKWEKPEKK